MEAESKNMARNVRNLVGSEVQGWMLTDIIGSGADGIVYAGKKDGVERAVKLFFPELLERNGLAAARERLELQLELIGEKHHKNLVEFFDGGDVPELSTIYIVMELVPGKSLDKLIGHVPASTVCMLASQLASVARFLEEELELIHRDIKPANIIVSEDYSLLTLLDLGIVYKQAEQDDKGRHSGDEFVATVRYSPPEFVWREEQEEVDGAWRAVTFYQIGATLHDMIMGAPLFSGYDQPRAKLYESVKFHTPIVASDEVDSRLVRTVQACLLKDWRHRLSLVSWDSFSPGLLTADVDQDEKQIKLLQLRRYEKSQAEKVRQQSPPGWTRKQELWSLNATLIGEVRNYLLDTSIFPKCSISENSNPAGGHLTQVYFDEDQIRGFPEGVVFTIDLSIDDMLEDATKLSVFVEVNGESKSSGTWTEMFSVEAAFEVCKKSFLGTVKVLLED